MMQAVRKEQTAKQRELDIERDERICKKCENSRRIADFTTFRCGNLKVPSFICKLCAKDDHYFSHVLRKFKISREEYERMLLQQDGGCAICAETEDTFGRSRLSVDHNHDTGNVRGILCNSCNNALGLFKDKPEVLRKAAKYLEFYEEL